MSEPATSARPIDPVPADVRELLAFFESNLAGVRFPDIDHDVLCDLASDVRAQADEVERARALLQDARNRLEARQATLLGAARKGIAYAQVYAENDGDLLDRLTALSLLRDAPAKKPRRRRLETAPRDAAKPDAAATEPPARRGAVVAELPLARLTGT